MSILKWTEQNNEDIGQEIQEEFKRCSITELKISNLKNHLLFGTLCMSGPTPDVWV